MKKPELKPCPFCGEKAELVQFANPKEKHQVRCIKCGCGTDGYRYGGKDASENIKINATAWNKRISGNEKVSVSVPR